MWYGREKEWNTILGLPQWKTPISDQMHSICYRHCYKVRSPSRIRAVENLLRATGDLSWRRAKWKKNLSFSDNDAACFSVSFAITAAGVTSEKNFFLVFSTGCPVGWACALCAATISECQINFDRFLYIARAWSFGIFIVLLSVYFLFTILHMKHKPNMLNTKRSLVVTATTTNHSTTSQKMNDQNHQ